MSKRIKIIRYFFRTIREGVFIRWFHKARRGGNEASLNDPDPHFGSIQSGRGRGVNLKGDSEIISLYPLKIC